MVASVTIELAPATDIELGLVLKTGLVELADGDRATLYGAFLGVPDAADRRLDPGFGEALGIFGRDIRYRGLSVRHRENENPHSRFPS